MTKEEELQELAMDYACHAYAGKVLALQDRLVDTGENADKAWDTAWDAYWPDMVEAATAICLHMQMEESDAQAESREARKAGAARFGEGNVPF
jgi:hypothetical protein